jgi:hypothetical protein
MSGFGAALNALSLSDANRRLAAAPSAVIVPIDISFSMNI